MIYEIEPLDNFFFRSQAPFEAGGETTVLHSIFPPLPSTYAGAFRPLLKNGETDLRGIKVGWNGLMSDNEFCFPMPEDYYVTEQDGQLDIKRKVIRKKRLSNYPLDYMISVQEKGNHKPTKDITPYIREAAMHSYLNADSEHLTCMDMNKKLTMETRIGIEVDKKSKVSKEQRIYTTMCIRPEDGVKLAADIQGDLSSETARVKFGGEGKAANVVKSVRQLELEAGRGTSRYFKLYLATPAVFANGWIPGWMDKKNFTGYFSFRKRAVKVKLISACIGRAVPSGGFGYIKAAERRREYRPRELRFAVPAGSVYYFELLKGTYEDAVKLFHKRCISDYREGLGFDYQMYNRTRYCDRGFGYSLIGRLSKDQEDLLHV